MYNNYKGHDCIIIIRNTYTHYKEHIIILYSYGGDILLLFDYTANWKRVYREAGRVRRREGVRVLHREGGMR